MFEFTDHDGDRITVEPYPECDDGPAVAVASREAVGRSVVVHVPLGRVEEVVAGIRGAARSAGGASFAAVEEAAPQADGDHFNSSGPELPRRFHLLRHRDVSGISGTGVVALGVRWPDGTASVRWLGARPSTVHWDNFADAEAVHGHAGATEIVWNDEAPPCFAGLLPLGARAVELCVVRGTHTEHRTANGETWTDDE
ncbi:hypothetical protein ACWGLE_01290 [Streptomyces sp. NPDC055897]